MNPGFLRSLLLILLLAFAGLASAVPCIERGEVAPALMSADSNEQSHCSSEKPNDCSNEHAGNCSIECGCCPGLGNNLAAPSDSKPIFITQSSCNTAYFRFNVPPEPDTELRPPIHS
ncbi:hypothetical protein Misp06_01463 [Microbulbifer sp. NBRC 101763]|uniref:hypothetical protein n=1 Tax=Microbulbifer sp. NBRC 101763 TaxID=1113820 RepID=UPI0030B615D7